MTVAHTEKSLVSLRVCTDHALVGKPYPLTHWHRPTVVHLARRDFVPLPDKEKYTIFSKKRKKHALPPQT
jgi:hypothetical protein